MGLGADAGIFEHLLSSPAIPLIILDVDYGHPPEYPFPAALDDVHAVISHVFDHPTTYDSSRLIVGGFNAGGNLAFGISILLGGKAGGSTYHHPLKAVCSMYPVVNLLNASTPSKEIHSKIKGPFPGIVIPKWLKMKLFWDSYLYGSNFGWYHDYVVRALFSYKLQ